MSGDIFNAGTLSVQTDDIGEVHLDIFDHNGEVICEARVEAGLFKDASSKHSFKSRFRLKRDEPEYANSDIEIVWNADTLHNPFKDSHISLRELPDCIESILGLGLKYMLGNGNITPYKSTLVVSN